MVAKVGRLVALLVLLGIARQAAAWQIEAGAINLPAVPAGGGAFVTVNFRQAYPAAPLVFVLPANENAEPAAVRIRNVTATTFELAQVEPAGASNGQPAATVHYLAIEPGNHLLPDGTRLSAGTLSTTAVQHGSGVGGGESWATVNFGTVFGAAPAVIAQIQTMVNESGSPPGSASIPWLTVAMQNVGTAGAQMALERSEVGDGGGGAVSSAETIAYLAIEAGRVGSFTDGGGATITYESIRSADNIVGWANSCVATSFAAAFAAAPLVLANNNTHDGGDGGWLRRCSLSSAAVGLVVDEDQRRDAERSHTTERAGIIAFSAPFDADIPPPPAVAPVGAFRMEVGSVALPAVAAGSTAFATVSFQQTYAAAPVVFVLEGNENPEPASVRIRGVTASGFQVSQVEPAGEDGVQPNGVVHYLAVESGVHQLPDGTVLEVGTRDTSAVQARFGATAWEPIVFAAPFAAAPAVLAQVQSMNNEAGAPPGAPSSPWIMSAVSGVTTGSFLTALELAETGTAPLATSETVGWLAIEGGRQGSFFASTGVSIAYETLIGTNIQGWQNGCFTTAFANTYPTPPLAVASQNSRNGNNGGWLRRCSLTNTALGLTVDEDQASDSERSHISELAGILVFSQPFAADFGLVGYYALDEAAWSGAAGEVLDGSGNARHGNAVGAAQTTPDGRVCRAGDTLVDGDAVQTPVNPGTLMGPSGSVSFWFRPTWTEDGSPPERNRSRMLFDASSASRHFMLAKIRTGGGGIPASARGLAFLFEDSSGAAFTLNTTDQIFTAATWVHLAVTWDFAADTFALYVDGALKNSAALPAAADMPTLSALRLGYTGGGENPYAANTSAAGTFDELYLHGRALSAAEITALMNATHPCPGAALDHFRIDIGAGAASTCLAQPVTITAEDALNAVLSGYTGSVTITTSANHGDWSVNSAAGPFANGAPDDGAATYTFVAADGGSIVLDLANTHADDLTITVSDAVAGVATTSAPLSFRDNAFVITPTDPLGPEIVSGRDHALRAELWRRDAGTGDCAIATAYDSGTLPGAGQLKAWIVRDAIDPGGAGPTFGASPSMPNAAPGANNVSLSFAAGVAAFDLATTDVGKYALGLRDDTSGFAVDVGGNPRPIDGSSATFTVRPFGIAVVGVQAGATPNPGVDTPGAPGAGIFTSAGSDFQATVRGARWQAADDGDNDGVPDPGSDLGDNPLTASYAWLTTLASGAPFEPATGVLGALRRAGATPVTVAQGEFVAGTGATPLDLAYEEVGSFTMQASATNYLNSAGVNIGGGSGVIGRFTPLDFFAAPNAPQFQTQCAAGTFSYIGQIFDYITTPALTVTARNAFGITTQNYTGVWMRITDTSLANKQYAAGTGTLDLSGVPPMASDPGIVDNADGTVTLNFSLIGGLAFQRAAPEPPFDAEIALSIDVLDLDAVAYGANPAAFGATTPGNGIGFDADKSMRWGRAVLTNAFGPEVLALDVPLAIEYWDDPDADTVFTFNTHTADACTGFLPGDFALSNYAGNLDPGETAVTGVVLAAGSGAVTLSPPAVPGSPNDGSVDLTGTVPAHLRFDWDGDTLHDDDPVGRATFGIFSGPGTRIYLRELY